MEEKKKPGPAAEPSVPEPDNFIKNPEADTEDIVDFMHEEIKKRPMNRKKLLRRARETLLIAVVFGVVSCVVFAILLPVINNLLYPSEKTAKTVSLPEEKPSEELSPEELVENEREREVKEEKEWIRRELSDLLDEKAIGIEEHKRISASLQELAAQSSGMIAQVSGIKSDTDWFNDVYENRKTASGLVTKKTASAVYVLVQSRRISDAERIIVTFYGGTEAEAQEAGSDEATGLTVLQVPLSSIPAAERAGIREAPIGSSAGPIITGAPVIAIGSPTGMPGSVIYGNVTAADESLEIMDNDLCRLTTDIYGSGDATGVLINLDGSVVGLIDMHYRDSGVPNMLCAIGISELRPILRRMEAGGTKAFLGISGIDVSEGISEANGIPVGVWVTRIEEDSPAMAAGLQKGDIITGFDKTEIFHMAGLIVQLEGAEPDQNVTLRIMRQSGGSFEEVKVPVTLQ
ncbi:MAG: S1C family serine protease [Eubacteriales bacterium]|nr:S1C family serine protease [Eubacteriales bacterium]